MTHTPDHKETGWPDDFNPFAGQTGGATDVVRFTPGETIIDAQGNSWVINSPSTGRGFTAFPVGAQGQDRLAGLRQLPPGQYLRQSTGKIATLGFDGVIAGETDPPPPPDMVDLIRGPDGLIRYVDSQGNEEIAPQWVQKQYGEDGSEGSGGGGGGYSIVGTTAPDPASAASIMLGYLDRQMDIGKLKYEEATAIYDRNFDWLVENVDIEKENVGNKLTADVTNAGMTRDYAQMGQDRAANIATAQGGLNTRANEQSEIVRQLLRSSLPAGTGYRLPMMGEGPVNRVNVPDLLRQGMPSLADQSAGLSSLFPDIGPAPQVTTNPIAPIAQPEAPPRIDFGSMQLPGYDYFQNLANQAQSGFAGWIR